MSNWKTQVGLGLNPFYIRAKDITMYHLLEIAEQLSITSGGGWAKNDPVQPWSTYLKSKQRRSTSVGRWVFIPRTLYRFVTCDRGAKVKMIPVRLSCFQIDNHISSDDLMAPFATQAVKRRQDFLPLNTASQSKGKLL